MESVAGSQESFKDKGQISGFVSSSAKVLAFRKEQHHLWAQRAFTRHAYTIATTLSCFVCLSDFNKRNGIHSLISHKFTQNFGGFLENS